MKSRRHFAAWAIVGSALVASITHVAATEFSRRWVINFDVQKESIVCLPWHVYFSRHVVTDAGIVRGDLVRVRARGIPHPKFPDGAVMGKMIAAVPGDLIEVRDEAVWINGAYWGEIDLLAKLKKPKGAFDRKEIVPPGHYFVMGTGSHSYDSRYWGFIRADQIIGRSVALL